MVQHVKQTLSENGATKIYMLVYHGILSSPAVSRISASKFEKVIVANTITPRTDVMECEKIEILDVSWLCAVYFKTRKWREP